jgi:hypothetical protein
MKNRYVEVIMLGRKDNNKLLAEFNNYINDNNENKQYKHIQELNINVR